MYTCLCLSGLSGRPAILLMRLPCLNKITTTYYYIAIDWKGGSVAPWDLPSSEQNSPTPHRPLGSPPSDKVKPLKQTHPHLIDCPAHLTKRVHLAFYCKFLCLPTRIEGHLKLEYVLGECVYWYAIARVKHVGILNKCFALSSWLCSSLC